MVSPKLVLTLALGGLMRCMGFFLFQKKPSSYAEPETYSHMRLCTWWVTPTHLPHVVPFLFLQSLSVFRPDQNSNNSDDSAAFEVVLKIFSATHVTLNESDASELIT